MTHIAECPECGKKYKVPHFDKEWSCKVCEVALLSEEEFEEEYDEPEEPAATEEESAPRRRASARNGGLTDADQRDFRRRAREASQQAAKRRNIIVAIGFLILIFGGGGTMYAMTRGRAVEATVEQFRKAWNQGDFVAAAQLAQKGNEAKWVKNFERRSKRMGWEDKPPTLGKHMYLIDGMPSEDFVPKRPNGKRRGAVLVGYDAGERTLIAEFARRQGDWCLTGMDYRGFE
ncbi:MAG: hypothetical protein P1V35_00560 [Planctomycetota bacterium]|nr:hypothetical protein [Planctomycetota bacterium]